MAIEKLKIFTRKIKQQISEEALLTVIISPSHLAHTMDERTRANDNGELRAGTNVIKLPEDEV